MTNTFLMIILITGTLIYLFLDLYLTRRSEKQEQKNREVQDMKDKTHDLVVKKLENPEPPINCDVSTYDDVLKALDLMISTQVYFKFQLDVNFQSTKIVNFEKTVPELCLKVQEGMNVGFLRECKKFHTEEWICDYIRKRISMSVISYIEKNKNNL